MFNRGFALCAALAGLAALISSSPSVHAGTAGPAASEPQLIDDASLSAKSVTMGGAEVLPTTRTVPHWWGSTVDPNNGVTYGYNMVGADPNTCSGAACSVTDRGRHHADRSCNVGGMTFNGNDVLAATLASPQFATQRLRLDAVRDAPALRTLPSRRRAARCRRTTPASSCSSRTRRCGRSSTRPGSSTYHLILHPNVLPAGHDQRAAEPGHAARRAAAASSSPTSTSAGGRRRSRTSSTQADPTHLAALPDRQMSCCTSAGPDQLLRDRLPRHAGDRPRRRQRQAATATRKVQTFAWASYVSAGHLLPAERRHRLGAAGHPRAQPRDRRVGGRPVREQHGRALADADGAAVRLHGHPRDRRPGRRRSASRRVRTPSSRARTRTARRAPTATTTPRTKRCCRGSCARAPNTVSEPTQSPSTNIGRYTLMGDLNPFPGFRQPATGCQ